MNTSAKAECDDGGIMERTNLVIRLDVQLYLLAGEGADSGSTGRALDTSDILFTTESSRERGVYLMFIFLSG